MKAYTVIGIRSAEYGHQPYTEHVYAVDAASAVTEVHKHHPSIAIVDVFLGHLMSQLNNDDLIYGPDSEEG